MPVQEIHARTLAKSAILSSYQMPTVIPLNEVIQVLERAKIRFVLVGGYQANGTIMVRPSASSTAISSFVSLTLVACALTSTVEVFIPAPHEQFLIFLDQLCDSSKLRCFEALVPPKTRGREPKFRLAVITFHMDMRRFITIPSIKEKPVGSRAKHGRHSTGHSTRALEEGTGFGHG